MHKTDKYVFEKLTPVSNSDLGIYEDALSFVFENDDVRNVAISGAYGAGKSSILESYKEKHKDKQYVHISLAHFAENKDGDEKGPVNESVLEGKILNQLIHQIPSDKIPQTNFKVKKAIKRWQPLVSTFLALVFAIAIIEIFFFRKWAGIVNSLNAGWIKNILNYTATVEARLFCGFVAFGIVAFFLYKLIHVQQNRHILRKLNVQGNEIEIFEKTEESYFDKYLNEVLYLFENVGADVIVFEDMDRFDANRIFERLREVNTLTNLQRKKEKKDVLRFFYLLRDDIFISKDRTKFFDYIIPVVPVVDGSNSYNQFISHLKRNNLYKEFDDSFLQGLSLYVDDMRLLKNICNEFLVYYNRLNTTELDYNKMLAMVTYKNLFPRDFSDLQLGKGFVGALFAYKDVFIRKAQEEFESKIADKRSTISQAKQEPLESIEELNMIDSKKSEIANRDYYTGQKRREYDNWKKNVYPRRKASIENRHADKMRSLELDLETLQRTLQHLSDSALKDIITRENIDSIFGLESTNEIGETEKYESVKSNDYFPLLKYLIRNGYIDESYPDYMTYFYEDSLSRTDKMFLRSVTDKKAKEPSYKLKDPRLVFSRLKPNDLEQEETLNFSLADYMLHNAQGSEKLSYFFEQLKNQKRYQFIEQYLEASEDIPTLIMFLGKSWPELFSEVLTSENMSSDHVRKLSVDSIYYLDDQILRNVNNDGKLRDYISSAPDYLAIENPNIERLVSGFDLLDVAFSEIDYSVANQSLFNAVYEKGIYEITFANIQLMLSVFYQICDEDDIRHKTTTLVFQNPGSPLEKKIKEEMDAYLATILTECHGVISDIPGVVIDILNDNSISDEHKTAYIERLQTTLSDISLVQNKKLWEKIVEAKRITCSEKNIIEYYMEAQELDEPIISLINGTSNGLDFSLLDESYAQKQRELFEAFVKSQIITTEAYERVVPSFNMHFDQFAIADIADEKMHILIAHKIVKMNKDTLQFIRKRYPSLKNYYIEKNIDAYVEIIDASLFSFDELIAALSMNISEKNKLQLLRWTKKPITIKGKGYSEIVQEHILQNNLFAEDIPYLYSIFSNLHPQLQKTTLSFAIKKVADIVKEPGTVDKALKEQLLGSTDISLDQRTKLLIADIPNLEKGDVLRCLCLVGKEEFSKVFDPRARPRFEDNPINQQLLQAFVGKGWIHESYQDGGYLKYRRNPRKN